MNKSVSDESIRWFNRRASVRGSLTLYTIGACIMVTWSAIAQGLPLTHFAKLLDMPAYAFGVLGSITYYGYFFQLIGSYMVERFGHRKGIFIVGGLLHRAVWILIGLLPLILPFSWTWVILIVMIGFSWSALCFADPARTIWFADLIPSRIVGRYLSRRTSIAMIVTVVAGLAVAYVIDLGEKAGPLCKNNILIGFFILAGIIGSIEFILYIFIYNPPTHKGKSSTNIWKLFAKPLKDREFMRIVFFHSTFLLTMMMTAQYTILFYLDILKLSNSIIAVLAMIPNFLWIGAFPFWGKLVDKVSYKPVFAIGAAAMALQFLFLVFMTPSHFIILYILGTITLFFFPGIEMALNVVIMDKAKTKDDQGGNSSYSAVLGVCTAITGVASGLLAAVIVGYMGKDWHLNVLGLNLTYHSILFLFVCGIRLAIMLWIPGMKNVKGYTIRQTLREIALQMKSDAIWIIGIPRRLLRQTAKR